MTAREPSRIATVMTWLALALAALMLFLGIYCYGFTLDVQRRFWSDIGDRIHGPMTFRFYLQPTMALIAAIPDGIRDAREGHKAFFWTALLDSSQHGGRLREGAYSTARIILLGLSMDAIYQFKVLDQFYPAEAVIMAILLAVIPYFIFRWLIEKTARWWFARQGRAAP
jgi:hypothetical protein